MYLNTVFKYNVFKYCPALTILLLNMYQPLHVTFTPKGGRYWEENFLRYLDLCYGNPAHHKLKTLPLL